MVKHFSLTLDGTAQRLSDVLADTTIIKFLSLQAHPTNLNPIYIGTNESGFTLSSSDYGFRIEAPVASIPAAPSIFEFSRGLLSLGDLKVLGTNTEVLHGFLII